MIAVIFLIFSVWIGHLIEEKYDLFGDEFWGKASAAIVIGTLFSTWLVFLLSFLLGFRPLTLVVAISAMFSFIVIETLGTAGAKEWPRKSRLSDFTMRPTLILLLLLIMPFFIFGLRFLPSGDLVFYGNYMDMSYHMSMISSFLEQNFMPDHPQSAGAKMSYHFMVNFHSAILSLGGLDIFASTLVPQILFALSLCVCVYFFLKIVLKREAMVLFASFSLLFCHIGTLTVLFSAIGLHADPSIDTFSGLSQLKEQFLFPFFNFLDPIVNLFQPQRPFLFAFPLSLTVLAMIYKMVVERKDDHKTIGCVALIIGLMPLFHFHSFLILASIFTTVLLVVCKNKKTLLFAILLMSLSLLQISFIMSQEKPEGFSSFDVHMLLRGEMFPDILCSALLGRVIFWLRAAGFPFILGIPGAIIYFRNNRSFSRDALAGRKNIFLAILFAVTSGYFILINFYRFSPNWGDSNKFFLFMGIPLAIFSAHFLYWLFVKGAVGKILASVLILLSSIGPFLVEAETIFSKTPSTLFTSGEIELASWIRANTPKESIFLTSDDFIHYLPALAGRRVVDGAYNLTSGFYRPGIQDEVAKIYSSADLESIRKLKVSYIVLGPQEFRRYHVEKSPFDKLGIVKMKKCKEGEYFIYSTID